MKANKRVLAVLLYLMLAHVPLLAFAATAMTVTKDTAADIVLTVVPNGKVSSVTVTETHEGLPVYKVSVVDGGTRYEFFVNTATGHVEGFTKEELIAPPMAANTLRMDAFISDKQAQATALEHAGGGYITKCLLSHSDGGGAVYEVGVLNGSVSYVFVINAYTGEVKRYTRAAAPVQATPAPPAAVAQAAPTTRANTSVENAALARVGGGTVVRVETKHKKNGTVEYKVIIVNGDNRYDVTVTGNSVTKVNTHRITQVYNTAGLVDVESAKSLAIQRAGGGIVTEVKLDFKKRENISLYHIHVGRGQNEYCVKINAVTGVVQSVDNKHKS